MRKALSLTLFSVLMLALLGCDQQNPAPSPTQTPVAEPTAALVKPEPTVAYRLTWGCTILNSKDVGQLLPRAEVQTPVHKESQVDHLIFSSDPVSATESSCIYYSYYLPGSVTGTMIQVTTWVDLPGETSADSWNRAWEDAKAKATQPISGIGDDAFFDGGNLTFKKKSIYVTVNIQGDRLDPTTPDGAKQQVDMEKTIASTAASHLP